MRQCPRQGVELPHLQQKRSCCASGSNSWLGRPRSGSPLPLPHSGCAQPRVKRDGLMPNTAQLAAIDALLQTIHALAADLDSVTEHLDAQLDRLDFAGQASELLDEESLDAELFRDRKHQPLLSSIRANPAGALRRLAALRQRAKPRESPRRNRPQAQKPPRAWPGTEPSPPVANPASGNQLRPTPYGGPRAERPSAPNTRSVAEG